MKKCLILFFAAAFIVTSVMPVIAENKVEREIGAPVSRSKIAKYDDTEYYIGDFISSDGVYRTRLISMDNIQHFPFGSMEEVTWEFLKHFNSTGILKPEKR